MMLNFMRDARHANPMPFNPHCAAAQLAQTSFLFITNVFPRKQAQNTVAGHRLATHGCCQPRWHYHSTVRQAAQALALQRRRLLNATQQLR
jgi:hypothetical protein